jgi:hypothetical protein
VFDILPDSRENDADDNILPVQQLHEFESAFVAFLFEFFEVEVYERQKFVLKWPIRLLPIDFVLAAPVAAPVALCTVDCAFDDTMPAHIQQ